MLSADERRWVDPEAGVKETEPNYRAFRIGARALTVVAFVLAAIGFIAGGEDGLNLALPMLVGGAGLLIITPIVLRWGRK